MVVPCPNIIIRWISTSASKESLRLVWKGAKWTSSRFPAKWCLLQDSYLLFIALAFCKIQQKRGSSPCEKGSEWVARKWAIVKDNTSSAFGFHFSDMTMFCLTKFLSIYPPCSLYMEWKEFWKGKKSRIIFERTKTLLFRKIEKDFSNFCLWDVRVERFPTGESIISTDSVEMDPLYLLALMAFFSWWNNSCAFCSFYQ